MKQLTILLIALTLFSCKNEVKKEDVEIDTNNDLNELFALMQGSFDSRKQATEDTTYYNIALHMYPIWEGKGNYLYVEQALKTMQTKPYRQRIYEVTQLNDSTFSSAIYKIPNDSLWIGKWKTPKAFDSISPSDLIIREGCAVLLKKTGKNQFKGSTTEDHCKSSMRGASYATSMVEISSDKIMSWDRGFDAEGIYVWGAEKGGYIFNKLQ